MELILWLLAIILIVFGVIKLVNRDVLLGIILIVVGLILVPLANSLFY